MPLYPNSASPLALNAKLPADKPKWFWTSPIVSTSPIGLARLFAFSRTCLGKMANGEWQNIVPGSGILSIVTRNHLWLCSASILIYHVLCPSAWLRRFNNATQPIVELHTWFWVSISSPCSIIHGLTQIATLKIFCHSRPYISSIMEIHIPDITIPWRHITHLKEKWPTNLGCCSFLRVFDYQYVENLPVLLLHWAFLADKLC